MIIDQLFTRPLFEQAPMASPEQLAYNKLRAQYDGYQAMTSGGGNTAMSRDQAHAAKLATVPAELARMAAELKAKGIDAEAQYDALGGPKAAPVDANQLYEFAPSDDGDGPDQEELLRRMAAHWWNGNERQMAKVENTLAAMGWEIGQDEGYDDGGVFVVRAGDEHGRTYTSWSADELEMNEAAPPGAKAERMVKHIKQGYARDGKLTPKEKGIAFATAWKAHNAGRVEEGEITKNATGLKHRATDKYGAGDDEPHHYTGGRSGFSEPGKYARDLEHVNKQLVKDLDASMGISWKNRGTKGIEVDEAGVSEGEYDSRKPFGVRYKVFAGREGRMTTREYWTSSEEKLQRAVDKIQALDNFYEIDGYSYPKESQGVAEGSEQKPAITYKDYTLQYDYQTEDDDPEGYSTATTYYFDVLKDGDRVGEAEYFDYFGNLTIRINGKTKEFGFRHPLASQISQLVSSLPDEQKKDLSDPRFESQDLTEVFADQGSGSTDRDNADYMKRRRAAKKAGYTGRETKAGTWRVFKDGNAVAAAGPFKSADEAAAWIKKHKQGVTEMDKSEPSAGRDGSPRLGPDKEAKPISKEKMTKDAGRMLNRAFQDSHKKKDVKEAYPLGYSTDPAQGKWYREGMDAVKYGTVGDSIKEIAKKHYVPPQWVEAFTAGFRQQEEWSRQGAARGFPGGRKPEPYTKSKAMPVPPTFPANTNARGGGGAANLPDRLPGEHDTQLPYRRGMDTKPQIQQIVPSMIKEKSINPLMLKLKRAMVKEGRVKELADDLKTMPDADFMKKYGKAKAAIRRDMKRVDEAQTNYTPAEMSDILSGKKTQQQVDAERAKKPLKEIDAPAMPAAPAAPAAPTQPAAPAKPAATTPVAAKPAGQQPFKPNQTMDPQQAAAANKAAQEFMQGLMAQLQQIKPVAESRKLNENWFTDKVAAAANWMQQKLKENPLIEIGLRFLPVTSTILAITDVIGAIKGGNLADATRMIANLIPGGQQLAQAVGAGQAVASGDIAGAAQKAASAAGLKDVASGISAGQLAQAVSETAPVNELSTNQLARYKTAAARDAKKADQAGDFKRGDKRLSGMVQATKKQFDNDAKKVDESRAARRALMARIVNSR